MRTLDTTPLASLLQYAREKTYKRGQIIIYQDTVVKNVYMLEHGAITLYDIDEKGNEKILHILRAPSLFPLAYNFDSGDGVVCFYGALNDVTVYSIPYQEFRKRMFESEALTGFVFKERAIAMHELLVRIGSMGKTSSRDKLLAALRFLAVHHASQGRGKWLRVHFPVTHQLLADLTGVTRESITMAIRQLQDENIIRYVKQMVLEIDFEQLTKM